MQLHKIIPSGVPFQISQALATALDVLLRHQQQILGRIADPTPQEGIRNLLEVADQIERLVVAAEQVGTGSRQFARPLLTLAVCASPPVTLPFTSPGTEGKLSDYERFRTCAKRGYFKRKEIYDKAHGHFIFSEHFACLFQYA